MADEENSHFLLLVHLAVDI